MKEDRVIFNRGLKEDVFLYGELVFDVKPPIFTIMAAMTLQNNFTPTLINPQ